MTDWPHTIGQIITETESTARDLAKKLNRTEACVSHWRSGRNKPDGEAALQLSEIARSLGISFTCK